MKTKSKLPARFSELDMKKSSMYTRWEEYAQWTLPYIFPRKDSTTIEMPGPSNSAGPQAVNNLANKLITTMFPVDPFFRLRITTDIMAELKGAASQGDTNAQGVLDNLDKQLLEGEQQAMQKLGYNKFRTESTNVAKSLIITGNALLYHPEDDSNNVQSYGLRDYCVVRDLSGTVIELMTCDKKALVSFSETDRAGIVAAHPKHMKLKDTTEITLFTQFKLLDDGKYHIKQSAGEYMLDAEGAWTTTEFPYIPLTWNRVRGEDYGRGLVEDYAGSFHGLYTLNDAVLGMVALASDTKFLVDPTSTIDVDRLNSSKRGTYHSGRKDDVSTIAYDKAIDMAFIKDLMNEYQMQISKAFLLNSSIQRDAERVTAEEIRYVAGELDLAHGGVYSRFAEDWQLKLATLLLHRIDFKIDSQRIIYPQIVTGLDSLSRAGDLDNLRLFVMDMQLLNEVPEEIRSVIDPLKFAEFVGTRRSVDYTEFTKTAEQIQQEQQQLMQQQNQQLGMEANAAIAEEAGKQSLQE